MGHCRMPPAAVRVSVHAAPAACETGPGGIVLTVLNHAGGPPNWLTLWAFIGILGAALPLLHRQAWSSPTRNTHLVMCGVAAIMVAPGAPWLLLITGPALLAGAAGRLVRTAHDSPECVPCLLDAVAMSLMVLVVIAIGRDDTSMADHASQPFALLAVQLGICWAIAACWSRTRFPRALRAAMPRRSAGWFRTPAAVALAGSVLMAGSMSAMFVG